MPAIVSTARLSRPLLLVALVVGLVVAAHAGALGLLRHRRVLRNRARRLGRVLLMQRRSEAR